MQGHFTADISTSVLLLENTAGVSWRMTWNIFEFWREKKDVIILGLRAGTYIILGLTELSDAQRDELRGILAIALPKQ